MKAHQAASRVKRSRLKLDPNPSSQGVPMTYWATAEEAKQVDVVRERWGLAPRAAVVRRAVREFLARELPQAPAAAAPAQNAA